MKQSNLTATLLDEQAELSLNELCRASASSTDLIVELVDYGILKPIGKEQKAWRFSGSSLEKAFSASRLQHDFDINPAGVAFALDLLDEIKTLREDLHLLN